MVTHGVPAVGLAGWPVILTGWPVTVGVVSPEQTLSGTGARVYTAHRLAGRGDGYQCGLDWGRSSFYGALQCSHCKRCTSYGNSVCPSVCLSIRLSHAGIVSK